MNRKDFFKKLGIGVATIVVAPKVLAEIEESKPQPDESMYDFDSIKVDRGEDIAKRVLGRSPEFNNIILSSDILPTKAGYGIWFDAKRPHYLKYMDLFVVPSEYCEGNIPTIFSVISINNEAIYALPLLTTGKISKTVPQSTMLLVSSNFSNG